VLHASAPLGPGIPEAKFTLRPSGGLSQGCSCWLKTRLGLRRGGNAPPLQARSGSRRFCNAPVGARPQSATSRSASPQSTQQGALLHAGQRGAAVGLAVGRRRHADAHAPQRPGGGGPAGRGGNSWTQFRCRDHGSGVSGLVPRSSRECGDQRDQQLQRQQAGPEQDHHQPLAAVAPGGGLGRRGTGDQQVGSGKVAPQRPHPAGKEQRRS